MKDQLKIDTEPKRLMVTSEPYVVYTRRGFQPVIDVIDVKRRKEYFIYISARSIADALQNMKLDNGDQFVGVEFWIRKESDERMSPYVVED